MPSIDFRAFTKRPSLLFLDYLEGASRIRPFFDGRSWQVSDLMGSATRTKGHQRDRAAMAAALVRQQQERGASLAATRASDLGHADSVAIVTGQQAMLFGGPLLVLWKALATRALARVLAAQRSAPVVPVFWVASDDHDFAEIRGVTVLGSDGRLQAVRYQPELEPTARPASRIVIEASIAAAIDQVAAALASLPHASFVIDRLRDAYRPGRTLAEAFARFLSALLPDLVVLDPADPALKALAIPVLERELRGGSPTTSNALKVGEALAAAGYHEQVSVRPGFFNLFAHVDHERHALRRDGDLIEVRGSSLRLTTEEMVGRLRSDPTAFSPGALLRPLVQDQILPTAAYLGGPAELAYHAQIGPSYDSFGVPRPVLFPRPSLTLLEAPQNRALEAEGLTLADLGEDLEALIARWANQAHPGVETALANARQTIEQEMREVERVLGQADPTLAGAAESARGRALFQLDQLQEKSLRALKKRDQTRVERLRRTGDALFPGGALQERSLSFLSALARRGETLFTQVEEAMDLWSLGHQVVGP
jgi:bacillithiol biosynthesis cysteine-adding enzyme BshC